jgi:hypothetical protein
MIHSMHVALKGKENHGVVSLRDFIAVRRMVIARECRPRFEDTRSVIVMWNSRHYSG